MIQENVNNPNFKVIDVRSPGEYQSGHIKGAILIPLDELPNRLDELNKDDTHLMICGCGARSSTASETLQSNGFKAISL